MRRALITGCTGFVGQHLANCLRGRGYELHGVVQELDLPVSVARALAGVPLYLCDILRPRELAAILEKVRPEEIYHLAAITSVPFSLRHPEETFEANIEGTRNVLAAACALRRPPRLLFASTAQVYQFPQDGRAFTETSPLAPATPYALSKAAAELLVLRAVGQRGLRAVIVRPANLAGPGQAAEFALGNFVRQTAEIALERRKPLLETGDLTRERDFTDVRDAVRGMHMALAHGRPGEIYNICSGRTRPLGEAVNILVGLAERNIKVRTNPAQLRSNDPLRIQGSAAKLQRAAGWRPEIPFEQTMRDALERAKNEVAKGR
jgi:GDP-4-dehydro-6-deoxy-D-mannose reductase